MKLAFLFPGQGSQFAGMGRTLFETYPIARQTFEEADETLGFPLLELCFNGPDEQLKLTENTQPALLAVSTASARVLNQLEISPQNVAGHSLGEFSALVQAGALAFPDALRLVRLRGQFMQQAVPAGVGAMAAILNLPLEKLDIVLAEAAQGQVVSAANFNSPDQTVIAGHADAVARAMVLAKNAGARRAIQLQVSAPFHCSLMRAAQDKLSPHLLNTEFNNLNVPLINNWQAAKIQSGEEAREGLIQQIPNPVRWVDSIRKLKAEGVERFIEVGPGTVLQGLCRAIEPDLQGAKFGAPDDLAKVQQLLV